MTEGGTADDGGLARGYDDVAINLVPPTVGRPMFRYLRRQPELLFVIAIFALPLAGVSAYHVPGLWRRAEAWSQEPRRLTLAQLASDRPSEATHVVLTDFECGTHFVYEAHLKKGAPPPKPDAVGFGRAWIPLFEKSRAPEGWKEPAGAVVILDTAPTIETATGKHFLSRLKEMEGVAMPASVSGLPSDVRDQLLQSYPDTRFDECIVFEQVDKVRKEDTGFFAYALATISGLALLVGTMAIFFGIVLTRRRRRTRRGPPPLPRRARN